MLIQANLFRCRARPKCWEKQEPGPPKIGTVEHVALANRRRPEGTVFEGLIWVHGNISFSLLRVSSSVEVGSAAVTMRPVDQVQILNWETSAEAAYQFFYLGERPSLQRRREGGRYNAGLI